MEDLCDSSGPTEHFAVDGHRADLRTFESQKKTTARVTKPRVSTTKGHLSKRTAFVRELVKEVAGYVTYLISRFLLKGSYFLLTLDNPLHFSLAPYERRVIELLRNGKDKRARKLAKKRVSYCSLDRFDCEGHHR